jgi:Protein of unknown function (DUF3618)
VTGVAEKKSALTVPGAVADDSYKGTAAANPVLVLSRDAAPIRPPYYSEPQYNAPSAGSEETVRDTRSPAQIEADLDTTRARLSGTLDELQERLSPRTLVRQAGRKVRAGFAGPDGGRVRPRRAALAVGASVAGVAALAAARALRHRS